jgi:eukaryotic-like serine/threonine-protein kinase
MPSQPDDLVGKLVVGRYRVLEPLGRGGMGTVYQAIHEAIEKKVALKVLRAEYSAKPDLVTRFQREAISASRIKHPNVLDVFDFGQLENGCFYLAMEFLEGRDLADELERLRVLPADRAIRIALQVCKALAAAHGRGVVHRDLKPENVFLQLSADGEDSIKIVDFGIAQLRSTEEIAQTEPTRRRLTRTGMIFGTPEYMSPEQAAGKHVDLRVDVYSTGIILYEMLTGAVPFTGDTFFGVLHSHLNDPLPPMRTLNPDVLASPELEAVIEKALAKSPDARFQSMKDLATALTHTPEANQLAAVARRSLPSVTLAEFDAAEKQSAREFDLSRRKLADSKADTAPAASAHTQALGTADERSGRSDTVLAGEAATAPRRSHLGLLALGALVVAGAAVLVGLRFVPPRTAPTVASSEQTPDLLSSGAPLVMPAFSSAELAPPAPSASALQGAGAVRLEVITDPPGAVVQKDGFQVCDETPCDVTAAPNETFTLEAKKGSLAGSAKVQAQRDQKVKIRLAAKGRPPAKNPKAPCYTEIVDPTGLKRIVPAPCPKP